MRKIFLILLTCGLCSALTLQAENEKDVPKTPSEISSGTVLNGKWRRPDGGYVIEITQVNETGTLNAQYFNPRPIKVAAAQWRFGGGSLQLRIDLNDTGYVGAFYLLRYNPTTQRLEGEYHPASQETFEVHFEFQHQPTPPLK